MSEADGSSNPIRSRKTLLHHLRLGLIYFAALSLLMFWELRERVEFFADECDQVETSPHSALYTESYRLLLKWTSHPSPPVVSVIAIPSDLEEIRGNLCHARSYMADLLRSLAAQNPRVIVIDKFYGPAACASDPASTHELANAIQSFSGPIVIGESTNIDAESVSGTCLVSKPQLDFASPNVHHGLTRLTADTEKLPLVWKVRAPTATTTSARGVADSRDSLAFAAVKLYNPSAALQPHLQSLIDSDLNPYANVALDLPSHTSTDLLCSSGTLAMRQRWSVQCARPAAPLDLRGKVVLIGAEDPADELKVLGTSVWGFQLQARYIDVLLSGNYLHELPLTATILTFGAFVFFIEGLPTLLIAYWPAGERHPLLRFAYPRRRYLWVVVWAFACIIFSTALSLVFRSLPPLAVLGDIVFVSITRLLLFTAESTEHPFLHATKKGSH